MSLEVKAVYFRLLGSLLYNEPSETVINTPLSEELFAGIPYARNNKLAKKGQTQIECWLKSAPINELTDNVRTDYMRLLVGVGDVLAPPWGSVYLDDERLLFNENTLKVRQFYERYGMMVKKKHSEPDDHIGLELEFLAHLAKQGEDEAMLNFVKEYMLPWVFLWNNDVQKHARTDYYRGLANMAAGGIEELVV
jgi:TorA maturation chaperone TorD